jgi:hypothetical protein
MEKDRPAIFLRMRAMNKPRLFAAIAEFDNAVMAEYEPLSKIAYGDGVTCGRSCYLQQQLMLLRSDSGRGCSLLTEVQEVPQDEAKLRQRVDIGGRGFGGG